MNTRKYLAGSPSKLTNVTPKSGPQGVTIITAMKAHLGNRSSRQNYRFILSRLKKDRNPLPFRS